MELCDLTLSLKLHRAETSDRNYIHPITNVALIHGNDIKSKNDKHFNILCMHAILGVGWLLVP